MMQFHGGGVGHKSTHEATDQFLVDHDSMGISSHPRQELEDMDYSTDFNSESEDNIDLIITKIKNKKKYL
jgi:hypothetical protein